MNGVARGSASVPRKKIDDYLAFGVPDIWAIVPNIWAIDPQERRAYICSPEGWLESLDLVPRSTHGAIVLPLPEIFEAIAQ